MSCAHYSSLLDAYARDELVEHDRGALLAHARQCARCNAALLSVRALRALQEQPAPSARQALLTEIARVAAQRSIQSGRPVPQRNRFWMGAGIGSSLAAGILLTLAWFGGVLGTGAPIESTQLLALNGTRDVNIAINSPADIAHAELRIVVSGNIAVNGYEDRAELRWSARLDRGVNLLTLPVVLQSPTGGHLLVEVAYGSERKTFAVHVQDETASFESGEDALPSPIAPTAA